MEWPDLVSVGGGRDPFDLHMYIIYWQLAHGACDRRSKTPFAGLCRPIGLRRVVDGG